MLRHESPTTDTEFRIRLVCHRTLNELDSGPDASGILPPAAGTSQPFSENRSCCHDPTIRFCEWAGEVRNLSCRSHADGDQGSQQVCAYGQAGTFGNVVDAADNFQTHSGTNHARKYV